ncbi:hypothetical protein DERF_003237 [Dermatophagoides farinae]|uniref:Uncharacterized protein n=1 Tax=Dermatophagoides farinae TaxID=6954 RepID=A0A922LCF7_DERFA|nr:hypothetical protein DERF_003237 [Dermatophagoides farinae]
MYSLINDFHEFYKSSISSFKPHEQLAHAFLCFVVAQTRKSSAFGFILSCSSNNSSSSIRSPSVISSAANVQIFLVSISTAEPISYSGLCAKIKSCSFLSTTNPFDFIRNVKLET